MKLITHYIKKLKFRNTKIPVHFNNPNKINES